MSIDYVEAVRLLQKGRRAEQRGKALKGCLAALATAALLSLLKGWLFMLAVGVIRAHWIPQCPTVGYWWAVLVMLLLPPFGSSGKSGGGS
jgi:hypothetical protein